MNNIYVYKNSILFFGRHLSILLCCWPMLAIENEFPEATQDFFGHSLDSLDSAWPLRPEPRFSLSVKHPGQTRKPKRRRWRCVECFFPVNLQRLELVEEWLDEIGINPHESHPEPKNTCADRWFLCILTKHHTCLFFRKRINTVDLNCGIETLLCQQHFSAQRTQSKQRFLSRQHQTLNKTPEIQIETWRRCEFLGRAGNMPVTP